jgi:mono/diheme cytochrome c family protein
MARQTVGKLLLGMALLAVAGCSACSKDDLEIAGIGQHSSCLTRAYLATLPQIARDIDGGPDFGGVRMRVGGVYLDVLAKALGAPPNDDLIDAFCTDKYRSHFPAAYVAEHHPILVLTVDGVAPAAWAAKNHQDDPGPYFIAYEDFVPAFSVLSHADQPQVPTNVKRLNFSSAAVMFAPITPAGADPAANYLAGSPVQQGFTIAKQNCLRCHASGATGGTKSSRSWGQLANIARSRPSYFSRYILSPQSMNPQAQMPANLGYDEATRAALTVYFQTLAH